MSCCCSKLKNKLPKTPFISKAFFSFTAHLNVCINLASSDIAEPQDI